MGTCSIERLSLVAIFVIATLLQLYRLLQENLGGEIREFAQYAWKRSICPFCDCHSSKEGRTRPSRISFMMSCIARFRCWAGGTRRKNVSPLQFLLMTSESLASSSSPE